MGKATPELLCPHRLPPFANSAKKKKKMEYNKTEACATNKGMFFDYNMLSCDISGAESHVIVRYLPHLHMKMPANYKESSFRIMPKTSRYLLCDGMVRP